MSRIAAALGFVLVWVSVSAGQTSDSVDVTFTYTTQSNPTAVFVPGEFNNWGPNAAGVISSSAPSKMAKDPTTGVWYKTIRLRVGGNVGGMWSGAYEYKFNENGTSSGWLSDPINPRQDAANNNNSIIYVNSPTIFQLLPNKTSGVVTVQHPTITAYVFPSISTGVDTNSFQLQIDSATYPIPASAYNTQTKFLSFRTPSALDNGPRKITLFAKRFGNGPVSDSATFTVLAGAIRILNQGGYTTVRDSVVLLGSVEDTTIHTAMLVRNQTDTQLVAVQAGSFSKTIGLLEGRDTIQAIAKDSTGKTFVSSPYVTTRFVNHSPNAQISFTPGGSDITLSASASTDPDSGEAATLKFLWSVDAGNPSVVSGVAGSTNASIIATTPKVAGEYYFGLIATDTEGNKDTTRSYFTVNQDGSVTIPAINSNPQWVRMGRIYELFFNSFTPQQTINAAAQKLDYLRRLGVNILWVMPVMTNNARIDNGPGPGYNIVDFYNVAPQYGTNADFKNFVQQAHQLGMKVILDVTPNHTSYNHPFVLDARLYSTYSFHWSFYEHQLITNPNYAPELSEAITNDGFVYYGAFGDQILNYNWGDPDARAYMIGVYEWWVKQMGLDGYRFDVYWGPHARANGGNGGEGDMGIPMRAGLKHIKPDEFILGEAAGTGVGTEAYYADRNGGVDAAYDWNLLHNVVTPYNISALNANVTNSGGQDTMGFVPGPNSRFMRFLENHDEDRIAYVYGSYAKTMPMGTMIFTVPGIPMIYSGQEVGFGLGISNLDQRRRGIIDWNSAGKGLLSPHYQRLAWIRGTYPAFSTLSFNRLATSNPYVYAYTRPYADQNGIAVENYTATAVQVTISLNGNTSGGNLILTGGPVNGKTYYLNDVYNDTSYAVSFASGIMNFSPNLPAYGSAVYILSDSVIHLAVPSLTSVGAAADAATPHTFSLEQNYPNPFNPATAIRFSIPRSERVTLIVYDILGRVVAVLANGNLSAGSHTVEFDGRSLSSGVYLCRLSTETDSQVRRMLLLK
ncbi:MAG TPA: alpha-amylase family glycosyl hydrolase [Bacteroidota bacterium]|nr:alpha-amylase family glycosyl hydrolase [Bacteroidota bacterium]